MICLSFPAIAPNDSTHEDRTVNVGKLVIDALRLSDMSHKEAALICGLDTAQWSRGIHGLGSLDLWKLARLPLRVHGILWPNFLKAMVIQWLAETRAEYQEHK